MTTVTLYTRTGCHLCGEARALVMRAGRGREMRITEVDIDRDPVLRELYDTRVPVVMVDGESLDWPVSFSHLCATLDTQL